MKIKFAAFVIVTVLLLACHKHENNMVGQAESHSMVGNWNVDTLSAYFYDAAGFRGSETAFPIPGLDIYRYNYQFNADRSWVDSISSKLQGYLLAVSKGTYDLTSDSSFNLFYQDTLITPRMQPCHIVSLTSHLFIFSLQRAAVFNGRDSGYTKYVFRLSK
jgi:hypothetical protein